MARGSVPERQKKDGSTTFSIKYRTVDGTQVKRAVGSSRREAERALTAALAGVAKGEIRTVGRETFEQAATAWLARKRRLIEPSTYEDYETHLRKRLIPAFGPLKLRHVTRDRIEDYLAALDAESGLSRKTINDSLIPLRQILGRAVRDGVLATNAAISSDRDDPLELPYEAPTMQYMTRDEALRYLDACRPWYRPIAEVLIGAGLRIGELIALEWRDVAWDTPALHISRSAKDSGEGTTKGDRPRAVLIDPYLVNVLREHRTAQSASGLERRVFVSPHGKQLDRHNVRRRGHEPAVKAASLSPALRLHDLRHTAATLWLSAGESIYFAQQQLGHRDIQTTIDLYGHPDQAAQVRRRHARPPGGGEVVPRRGTTALSIYRPTGTTPLHERNLSSRGDRI